MAKKYLRNKGWFITRDGKLIRYSTKFIKRADGWANIGLKAQNGTFRVIYEPGFYNEFDFDSPKDFLRKVKPCFEKGLLEFINETSC